MSRWTKRTQSAAFLSWVDNVELRRRLKRCLQHIARRSIAAAFEGWASALKANQRNQRIMSRCIRYIQSALMTAAFNEWESRTFEHRRQKQQMSGVLGRLQQRSLALAWAGWLHHRTRLDVARRTVRRLQHIRVGHCFKRWQVIYAVSSNIIARREAVAGRIVRTWSNRQMAATFAEWSDNASSRKTIRGRMQRTMLRLIQHRLAAAFGGWAAAVASRVRRRGVASRAVRTLSNSSSSKSFHSWHDYALEHKQLNQRVRQLVARWRNRWQAQCFTRWCTFATGQRGALDTALRRVFYRQ